MAQQFDELFDTNVLVGVVQNLFQSQNWLLDRYFPNIVTSETQYISIDVDVGLRRLAPFSSPVAEAVQVESRRVKTQTYQPAYIKDKRAIDIYRPIRRMIGERLMGEMSPVERVAANIQAEIADQIDNIRRTEEFMAAQGLAGGSLTIAGNGLPSSTLNFGRDPSMTVTLTGTALWSASATATPVQNVEQWAAQVLKLSGAYPTDMILSPSAWQALRASPSFKDAFSFPRTTLGEGDGYRSGNSKAEFGPMGGLGGIYLGQWAAFNLYLYNDWYLGQDGTEHRMIADGTVILTSPAIEGYRAYAAILDPEAGYRATPYFAKSWVSHDPAQRFLLMQAAPIVFPARPNASLVATVTAANAAL